MSTGRVVSVAALIASENPIVRSAPQAPDESKSPLELKFTAHRPLSSATPNLSVAASVLFPSSP